ncbi:MAG TPA: hypothetical protein VGX96_06165, partial [Candidatus Elarobacter sp.]|nr:hypothetical protein [Candidatus Elarobacter sp.]
MVHERSSDSALAQLARDRPRGVRIDTGKQKQRTVPALGAGRRKSRRVDGKPDRDDGAVAEQHGACAHGVVVAAVERERALR